MLFTWKRPKLSFNFHAQLGTNFSVSTKLGIARAILNRFVSFNRWRGLCNWACNWVYITIFAGIIVKTILQLAEIKLTSSAMRDVNWSVQVTWPLCRLVPRESYKCPGGSVPDYFWGMVFLVTLATLDGVKLIALWSYEILSTLMSSSEGKTIIFAGFD